MASETDTELIPGAERRPDSTVLVQAEQVIPYIRRITLSVRIGGMRVASKPTSEISYKISESTTMI